MECEELYHGQHAVSLSTDHNVFPPMYWGKILVGGAMLALEGIIHNKIIRWYNV